MAFLKKLAVDSTHEILTDRSDNGTDFTIETVQSYLRSVGVNCPFGGVGTSEENGQAVRSNRTVTEMARTMSAR